MIVVFIDFLGFYHSFILLKKGFNLLY